MQPTLRTLPITSITSGESVEVAEITGKPIDVRRIAELGIRQGSRLKVLRAGRPCLIEIGGSRLSLRGDFDIRVLALPTSQAG